MGIIGQNDLFKEEMAKRLADAMPDIEQRVLDEIFRIIDKMDSAGGNFTTGVLTADKMMELTQVINQALTGAGYPQQVQLFMSDFGKVTINTAEIMQQVGGVAVRRVALSEIENKWKMNTVESLIGSGINENFKRPILKILDETISTGGSIDAAKKTLTEFVKGGKDKSGKLQSYLTQTARDSVGQLQGQQFQSIADAVETTGVRYVGGLLNDSRGQCYRWVRELKGYIPWEDLENEIKLAYKNQTAKLEKPEGHKWSGLMPNTNRKNFLTQRGGYNCTHTAVPVRRKP